MYKLDKYDWFILGCIAALCTILMVIIIQREDLQKRLQVAENQAVTSKNELLKYVNLTNKFYNHYLKTEELLDSINIWENHPIFKTCTGRQYLESDSILWSEINKLKEFNFK